MLQLHYIRPETNCLTEVDSDLKKRRKLSATEVLLIFMIVIVCAVLFIAIVK